MLITYRYQTPFCTHFCTGPLPCLFFSLLRFYILILSFKLSCSGSPQPSPFSLSRSPSHSFSLEALINMAHAYVNAGSAPPPTQALPRSLPLATSLYSTPHPSSPSLPLPCLLWLQFNIHFEKAHLHLRFCGTFACASTVFCFTSRAAEWACDRGGV